MKLWVDADVEAYVRRLEGRQTYDEIVTEVSAQFAKDLERIMRPAPANHDFALHDGSGIAICRRCGKPQTTRTRITRCDGVDTSDWTDSTR